MSIWRMSPTEDSGSLERNSVAWDQLLNNLELQMSSDASNDDAEEAPKPHAPAFSEDMQNHLDGGFKPGPLSAERTKCTKQAKSLNTTRDDDVHSRKDKYDLSSNRKSSANDLAGSRPSSGLSTTAKISGAVSSSSVPAGPKETSKSYFLVNSVRHCVQDERSGEKWNGAILPPRVMPEPQPWSAARQQRPTASVAPMTKTMVASSDAGAPAVWAYTPKPSADTPMPFQSPPKYGAVCAMPGSYIVPPSLELTAAAPPAVMPGNVAFFPADSKRPMGAPSAMPVTCTLSQTPMPSMNAAPFYSGKVTSVSSAAPAANPVMGYIYVDSSRCLHVAPGNGFPLPPTSSSVCPPPPPATQPLQLTCESSETAAMPQGVFSVPGISPMQCTATYAAEKSMFQPTMPSLPVSQSSAGVWGSSKAWIFRDGRWVSLSV